MSKRHLLSGSGFMYMKRSASTGFSIAEWMAVAGIFEDIRQSEENLLSALLRVAEPLRGEERILDPPPYFYRIQAWDLGWGRVITAPSKRIAHYLERYFAHEGVIPKYFVPVSTDMEGLLRHLFVSEDALTINYIHASPRFDPGRLGAITYYGSDLKWSKEVRSKVGRLDPLTIGVVRLPSSRFGKLCRLVHDGFISPSIATPDELEDLRIFLHILRDKEFLRATPRRVASGVDLADSPDD